MDHVSEYVGSVPAQLKVVLVTHFFPAHRGGIEIVAGEVARRLAAEGVSVTWFSSAVDPSPEDVPGISTVAVRATNFVERFAKLPYPIWSLGIVPKLWRAIRTADVVHLHDFLYFGSLLAFALAKMLRKPVVITQHIGFIPYDSGVQRALIHAINRVLGALVLGRVEQVVFISETVRQYFDRFVRYKRRPLLLPNGVDLGLFYPVPETQRLALRATLSMWPSDVVLLFVGRFVEKKGLHILRALVKEFPQYKWLFAGQGPLDPESWNLPNVSVYRDRHGSSLAELYRASDLLVLPSKGEGFPLVVQESMACGTPVLVGLETAAAYPGLGPLVFAENVLDSTSFVAWKRLIEGVTQQGNMLQSLRSKVAEFASGEWSWTKCAVGYRTLFQSLAKRPKV